MTPCSVVVCLFVVFSVVPNAYSIKCWKCRSIDDPKCGSPFDNSTLPITDCNYEKRSQTSRSMCMKIKQKVDGEWQYSRDCAHAGDVGRPDGPMRPGTHTVEYSMCDDKDGCNGSSLFGPQPLLLSVLSIMTVSKLL